MKRCFSVIILLILFGCTKPRWTQTTEGKYIYGKFNDKYYLEWNGPTNAVFVDGPGKLSLFDDEGRLYEQVDTTTNMGALSNYSYVHTDVGDYLGEKKKGLPNGFGVLINDDIVTIGQFKKGHLHTGKVEQYKIVGTSFQPLLIGNVKKGKISGVAKVYENGILVYEGSFEKGLRKGIGKAYCDNMLIYDGEWRRGKRHGKGIQYKEGGLIVYQGEWENDQYYGRGKLYENGVCTEGKWYKGRLTKSISTSVFTEMLRANKMWFSLDSLAVHDKEILQENTNVAPSQLEFVEGLNRDLRDYLYAEIDKRVDKRFGFWNLLRMIRQSWLSSDVKRAVAAQDYFCKNIKSDDIQNWINEKIDHYNRNSGDKLSFISLEKLPDDAIVNTNVALKIFDREALETIDVGVGILVDIIVCIVLAFIIGFFIGAFIPVLLPYIGIVDVIMAIIAFGIGLYLSVFRTSVLSLELESTIKQMLVDNYMLFIDSQNIISKLFGL